MPYSPIEAQISVLNPHSLFSISIPHSPIEAATG